MTESELRKKIIGVMEGWLGSSEANGKYKQIIDCYNAHEPLARGYKVQYDDEWCATTVSAAAIKAGLTDIIPTECSCNRMIDLLKAKGEWEENDGYRPEPADIIFYDWHDSGKGDNKGSADHVGYVYRVSGSMITAIEGNKGRSVAFRNIPVNGRYIRGFGVPKYASKADRKNETNKSGSFTVGDLVEFIGKKHYANSYSGAKSTACRPGIAKITSVSKAASHPYHLKATPDSDSNVYGWVDTKDIKGAGTSIIKVGDSVQFSGKVHYTSCNTGAKHSSCKGGAAKVTAIRKGSAHPYHLEHTGKGCTVYGWVDAKDISM